MNKLLTALIVVGLSSSVMAQTATSAPAAPAATTSAAVERAPATAGEHKTVAKHTAKHTKHKKTATTKAPKR
jgi:hypothetical protein